MPFLFQPGDLLKHKEYTSGVYVYGLVLGYCKSFTKMTDCYRMIWLGKGSLKANLPWSKSWIEEWFAKI